MKSDVCRFGEKIDVPDSQNPVFVELDIRPNTWGQLADVFFKPQRLKITLGLHNGEKLNYRMIACMAKSGFLMSPLIQNTKDFVMMYAADPKSWSSKRVQYFILDTHHEKNITWDTQCHVDFYAMRRS